MNLDDKYLEALQEVLKECLNELQGKTMFNTTEHLETIVGELIDYSFQKGMDFAIQNYEELANGYESLSARG